MELIQNMKKYVIGSAKDYAFFSTNLIPNSSKDLFIAYADDGNHFTEFGIHKDSLMVFDLQKKFEDGIPSCFVNKSTGAYQVLAHRKNGYQYAGKLVAVMNCI